MLKILAKFFKFCGKENGNRFKIAMGIGLVDALASAMKIPAIIYILIGLLSGDEIKKYIITSLIIMISSIIISALCKRFSTMLQTKGGYNASAFARIKIAEYMRYLPMGYFNSQSIGEISSVTTNAMENLGDVATRLVMLTCQGILETVMIIMMIAFFDWRIGIISAAGVIIFFLISSKMQKSGKKISEDKVSNDIELVSQIMEYIQGISEVKSYNLFGSQAKKLNAANEKSAKINTKMELTFIPFHFMQGSVTKITGAVIAAFILYASLESAGSFSSLLHVVDVCVDKANAILNLDTMYIGGKDIEPQNYYISLKNISFSYDKRKIIDNLSLSIPQKNKHCNCGLKRLSENLHCVI